MPDAHIYSAAAAAAVAIGGRKTDIVERPLGRDARNVPQTRAYEVVENHLADVIIYGGAVHGGKSHWLIDSTRFGYSNPNHRGLMLRTTMTDARKSKGLCDESKRLYGRLGATPIDNGAEHRFRSGARINVGGCPRDKDVEKYLSSQPTTVAFDQLEQFTSFMFFEIGLGRSRSAHGQKTLVLGSCNPVPPTHKVGGWLSQMLMDGGWVDPATGWPVPEMSGVVRWFYRPKDDLVFFDTREEARAAHPELAVEGDPLRMCFIPAKMEDNPYTTDEYRSHVMMLDHIRRKQLKDGNWKASAEGGGLIKREWIRILDRDPSNGDMDYWSSRVRSWDFAWSKKARADRTACIMSGRSVKTGRVVYWDPWVGRLSPGELEQFIIDTAIEDGPDVIQRMPNDPAAGAGWSMNIEKAIGAAAVKAGIMTPRMSFVRPSGSKEHEGVSAKVIRARPFAAACEPRAIDGGGVAVYGNIDFIAGSPHLDDWLDELHQFDGSENGSDDCVDATADGYDEHVARSNRSAAHLGPLIQ